MCDLKFERRLVRVVVIVARVLVD